MDQDDAQIGAVEQHIDAQPRRLHVIEGQVVHSDQGGGDHEGTPIPVVEQEGEQREDAEVRLDHASGLLYQQRAENHEGAGHGDAGSQTAGPHSVNGVGHQQGGDAHHQGDTPGGVEGGHRQGDKQQKHQGAGHQPIRRRTAGLQDAFAVHEIEIGHVISPCKRIEKEKDHWPGANPTPWRYRPARGSAGPRSARTGLAGCRFVTGCVYRYSWLRNHLGIALRNTTANRGISLGPPQKIPCPPWRRPNAPPRPLS